MMERRLERSNKHKWRRDQKDLVNINGEDIYSTKKTNGDEISGFYIFEKHTQSK